jgi:hypothetical protein
MAIAKDGETLVIPAISTGNVLHIAGDPGDSFTLTFGGIPTSVGFDMSGNLNVSGTSYTVGSTFTIDRLYKYIGKGSGGIMAIEAPGGGGDNEVVPCFFGNARVLTPSGYRRMDSMAVGDMVLTPAGTSVAIERVKRYVCEASSNTNPYVIPVGFLGAERRVLISPDHKVCLPDGRRMEAKRLGLAQEVREGMLTYYNLELAGEADMVVSGVPVESLAHIRRVVVTMDQFVALMGKKYGAATLSPATLANMKRTCRILADGRIEVPIHKKGQLK